MKHLGFDGKTLCGARFVPKDITDRPEDADCRVCTAVIAELRAGRRRTLPQTQQVEREQAAEVMSAEELGADLGLSAVTIRKLWKRGAIPSVPLKGGRLGMTREIYDAWSAKCRSGGWPKELSVLWTTDRGQIYFIQAEHDPKSPIKIGFTSHETVSKRVKELQTASPFKLRILATIPGSLAMEQGLHERFAQLRLEGEWFRAEQPLLDWIAGLKSEGGRPAA